MAHNETTRTFPRTLDEAFPPDNVERQLRLQQGAWMEHHEAEYEKYINIVYAFTAGFIAAMLIFGV